DTGGDGSKSGTTESKSDTTDVDATKGDRQVSAPHPSGSGLRFRPHGGGNAGQNGQATPVGGDARRTRAGRRHRSPAVRVPRARRRDAARGQRVGRGGREARGHRGRTRGGT